MTALSCHPVNDYFRFLFSFCSKIVTQVPLPFGSAAECWRNSDGILSERERPVVPPLLLLCARFFPFSEAASGGERLFSHIHAGI